MVNWGGCRRKQPWPISIYHPCIVLEGLCEITADLGQESWSSCRYSKRDTRTAISPEEAVTEDDVKELNQILWNVRTGNSYSRFKKFLFFW
jgi:hypothetical protein